MLAGCGGDKTSGGNADSGDVIKIGVFEPLTGANAAGGELEVRGIELANELYPEVLGKKIELVKMDNKSDKVEAATAAARLVEQENVDVVLGLLFPCLLYRSFPRKSYGKLCLQKLRR